LKNSAYILMALLVMITVTGCASISLNSTWKDPGVSAKKYRKLLVVGVAEKPQMRQVFEEVFASEFTKSGTVGVASYTITGVREKPSRTSLEDAVKKTAVEGVITTRLVDMKKDKDVRTGFIMTNHGFTDYHGMPVTYATFVHQPVEVVMSTTAAIETNLFDAATGRMVWSGTSSAVNPEGIITISRDLADSVIKAMTRDGLL
jgi:hypothetical protein